MALSVTFKGEAVELAGSSELKAGDSLPHFIGVDANLQEIDLASLKGQKLVVNFAPSLDTATCQAQLIEFNKRAAQTACKVVFITADLPFAQTRFCGQNSIENVLVLSDFRYGHAKNFGLWINNLPLKGLTARAVVVADENQIVQQVQVVREITDQPQYDAIRIE